MQLKKKKDSGKDPLACTVHVFTLTCWGMLDPDSSVASNITRCTCITHKNLSGTIKSIIQKGQLHVFLNKAVKPFLNQ